jgi:undecaprenyl-diphosphatase
MVPTASNRKVVTSPNVQRSRPALVSNVCMGGFLFSARVHPVESTHASHSLARGPGPLRHGRLPPRAGLRHWLSVSFVPIQSRRRSRPVAHLQNGHVSRWSWPRQRLRRGVHLLRDVVETAARWLSEQEAGVLVAVLLVLLAVFGFVKIAEELSEGELAKLDEWLLLLFRVPGQPHVPVGPPWLMEAAQDITVLGGRTMLIAVTVVVTGYLALERKFGAMWLVLVAIGTGGLLSILMKQAFGRGRPDLVPHLVAVTSPSFPSGHSMLAAIMYLTLGALLARFATRRRTKAYLITVALLATFVVGGSRVYLGVHYPSDVVAGWCAGLVWALVCWLVARYLQYRGTVDRSGRV